MTQKFKKLIVISNYYEKIYVNTLENPDEMDKCLDTCNPPKLNHEKS